MELKSIHTAISFFVALLLTCSSIDAQIDDGQLLGLINATTTEMNAISSPIEGSLLYNTTEKSVFQYNGSIWEKINSSSADEKWTKSGNSQYSSVSGNVGIGTTNPSAKLDVNGKFRLRDIPIGTGTDKILTADANGNIRKINTPITNKSYVQVFKENKTFGSGNVVLLNLFPQLTIQASKKVKIYLYVPTRDNTNSWGGLYVNAKANGTWYNLGSRGALQTWASDQNYCHIIIEEKDR